MTETGAEECAPAPTSADEFRAFLTEIGQTQSGFARTLIRLGDDRGKATILRHIQRMATGEARISGEMRVIMGVFRNSAKKRQNGTVATEGAGVPLIDSTANIESIARAMAAGRGDDPDTTWREWELLAAHVAATRRAA